MTAQTTAQTMVEKILSAKTKTDVRPNDMITVPVDFAFAHDGTLPLAIELMEDELGTRRVHDPEKVAGICDHASPSPSEQVSNVQAMMRAFACENEIAFYENGDGVCHQIVLERYAAPYKIVIGADSHTCTHGALGAFATGMGSTDLAAVMAYGKTWLKVPSSYRIEITGNLPEHIHSKDAFLYLCGKITADGATYMSMEFLGDTVDEMSVESRIVMCNMAIEAGGKCGLCIADDRVCEFLARYGRKDEYTPLSPDSEADYASEITIPADDIEPQIAAPHRVDNVAPVGEYEGVPLDQVCIGSCTNGRIEDLRIAARILKGEKAAEGTRLVVYPASRDVLLQAISEGVIRTLVEAGAAVCAPGCGFCIGRTVALADGEVVLSTQNRNFKGRMGNNNSEIYLSSVETAAVSAVRGEIADPRETL
ncbi:MAG: 3-isopropylmalate dehydratase large subunit [Methanosarcinales archaeon]|nr:3-isopropylmalate dehydratase large subunit [Methanosarcinales archaeon]